MARRLRLPVIVITSCIVGAVLGPLMLAAVAATLRPATDRVGNSIEVTRLLGAYQDRLPEGVIFLTVISPPDGEECGYSPERLFPNGIEGMAEALRQNAYADYEGYYVLNQWRNTHRDEAWLAAIAENMQKSMTSFEAGFLRRCIESTLFADACMNAVARYGESAPRFAAGREHLLLAAGHEDRIVCTFADGVAARRGMPLASRQAN